MQRQKNDRLFPGQSRFPDGQSLPGLADGNRFVQAGFTAIRSILMNDAPFGCLIDSGDHRLHILRLRFRVRNRKAFLHFAQASQDTSITEGTHGRLTSALGGGFCVSHLEKEDAEIVSVEARGGGHACQDAMRSLRTAVKLKALQLRAAAEVRLFVGIGPFVDGRFRRLFWNSRAHFLGLRLRRLKREDRAAWSLGNFR